MLNRESEVLNAEVSAFVDGGMAVRPEEAVLEQVRYRAVWRSRYLIILPIDCHPFRQSVSAVMEGDRDRLIDCLIRSPVKRVLLSSELPVAKLRCWAEISHGAGLSAYVRQRSLLGALGRGGFFWVLKYGLGRVMALSLLVALSPILVGLSLFLLSTNSSIFEREWCIGIGGKLYRELRFSKLSAPFLASWLMERVTALPRLINVFLGDVELWSHGAEISEKNALSSAEFI